MRTFGLFLAVLSLLSGGLSGQEAELDGIAYELGDPEAALVIVEYADLACDACAEFARTTWPAIRRDFIDTGRVRWRFVLFELGFRNSDEGARAAHCGALLGDFWELHDALYAGQDRWRSERNPETALVAIAVEEGYDEAAFRACYDDDPGDDRTRQANRAARRDRVRATPTFFVDGFRVQGALPVEVFVELIEKAGAGS